MAMEKRLVEIECEFGEFRREVCRLVVDSSHSHQHSNNRYEVHPWQRSRQILWNVSELSRVSKDLEIERREHVEMKRNLMRCGVETREKSERRRREREARQLRLQRCTSRNYFDSDRKRLTGIRRDLQRLRMSNRWVRRAEGTENRRIRDALLDNNSAPTSGSP